ncbi:MAG: class I SAM-dependent methyltransferase [Chloroflexota bacterium]
MTVPDSLLNDIADLGPNWHGAGTLSDDVLRGIVRLAPVPLTNSAETGTGRSTLLLSHLSSWHTVFTRDDIGDGDSLAKVRTSSLFNAGNVRFIVGPTQQTVPAHSFEAFLDLVLIDGPHAFPFPELEYYHFYPQIRPGGLLILDDIQIPSIGFVFRFLSRDDMWTLDEVIGTTAFFRRTNAPTFDTLGDGWSLQGYNETILKKPRLSWLPALVRRPLRWLWHQLQRD